MVIIKHFRKRRLYNAQIRGVISFFMIAIKYLSLYHFILIIKYFTEDILAYHV